LTASPRRLITIDSVSDARPIRASKSTTITGTSSEWASPPDPDATEVGCCDALEEALLVAACDVEPLERATGDVPRKLSVVVPDTGCPAESTALTVTGLLWAPEAAFVEMAQVVDWPGLRLVDPQFRLPFAEVAERFVSCVLPELVTVMAPFAG
jgi:hypothetical protein